jgi:hypothetical protein
MPTRRRPRSPAEKSPGKHCSFWQTTRTTRNAIETMAAQPQSLQKFDLGASIALTTAVLIVLQTHIHFERGTEEKWSLKVEKNPTNEALLKGLVQKLLSYAK